MEKKSTSGASRSAISAAAGTSIMIPELEVLAEEHALRLRISAVTSAAKARKRRTSSKVETIGSMHPDVAVEGGAVERPELRAEDVAAGRG